MARTISTCARRNGIDPVFAVEGDGKYRADWAWLGGQGTRDQHQVQRARRADLLGPARGRRAARGERGLHAQLSAFVAVEGQGDLPLHPAMVHRRWIGRSRPSRERERRRAARGVADSPALRAEETLRQTAVHAIADTRFVPEKGRNRIGSMVEGRPDWVISRQRAWGVPIALFVERKTGELLVDAEVNARIVAAIRGRRGRCVGRPTTPPTLLGPDRDPDDYEMRHRHSRRVVRQRLHPCVHARKRPLARPALARRPLSRRLRPAPRLVPVVACSKAAARAGARRSRRC